jgi:hypothetical protein
MHVLVLRTSHPSYQSLKFQLTTLRWFALVRSWAPWLVPRHGKSHFELDREAIVCSFLERGGRHVLLLALSGIEDVRTLLKSDGKGGVTLNVCFSTESPFNPSLMVSRSEMTDRKRVWQEL